MILNKDTYTSKSEATFMRMAVGFLTLAAIFIAGMFGMILFENFFVGISILGIIAVCYLIGCFWAWIERKKNGIK